MQEHASNQRGLDIFINISGPQHWTVLVHKDEDGVALTFSDEAAENLWSFEMTAGQAAEIARKLSLAAAESVATDTGLPWWRRVRHWTIGRHAPDVARCGNCGKTIREVWPEDHADPGVEWMHDEGGPECGNSRLVGGTWHGGTKAEP